MVCDLQPFYNSQRLMKRFFAAILTILYLSSTFGATIDLHYCMGEFVSFSLSGEQTGKCGRCGMETHGQDTGCCKNVRIAIESNDQHLPGQLSYDLPTFCSHLIHSFFFYNPTIIPSFFRSGIEIDHPPPFQDIPVFIKIHSYLI